ncbi:MAG: hypothetical protein V8R16_04895 [Bacilli bacterium]
MLNTNLRTEWGFRGSVITDYSSGGGRGGMNPEQGVKAGNDFWLNPNEGNNGAKLNRRRSDNGYLCKNGC